jgi:parallel beta-helix repeat protein
LILDKNEVYNLTLGWSESVVLNGNVTNFKVNNNSVHDNNNIAIDFIGYEGTAGTGETDRAREGECIGNTVYNISTLYNPVYMDIGAGGIYVDGGKDILIERNKVYNCDIGIEAASEHSGKSSDGITIRNNIVRDCQGYCGIAFGGSTAGNGTAINTSIFNNTLYNNDTNIVIQNANSATNVVKNNILNGTGTDIYGTIGSNVFANNMTGDASFVNTDLRNLHLTQSSLAIGTGASVNYGTIDYDGNPRVVNGIVDCGAYEFQLGEPVVIPAVSCSLDACGNTLSLCGGRDGTSYIFKRSDNSWSQDSRLSASGYTGTTSTGATGNAGLGSSCSLSADGNMLIMGGYGDNNYIGSTWTFSRNYGAWSQQGIKLIGSGYTGTSNQGVSCSQSANGCTLVVGGDGNGTGAGGAWIFTKDNNNWVQQSRLIGTGATGSTGAFQGTSCVLNEYGNTLAIGGCGDNNGVGGVWIFG